jgi:threonylcarbamoyladenosine tRNA methylthiotransferase MtaB
MGCYATRAPEELARLPNVAEVVTDKREIPDLLGRFGVIDIPTGVQGLGNRKRAFVKVQDGCLLRCSFCIIPSVRPNMYSRPLPEIVREVQGLVERGYREIVLTGIHLGHYGVDFSRDRPKAEWTRLSHLLDRLSAIEGDFRLRLSSIEATEVTRDLIGVLRDRSDRIAPHLHLSMQSGSDSVLRRMRRRWGSQRFLDRCQLLKDQLDRPAITTDIIVGFPGETEAEFEETLAVARAAGFSKIHVFSYSQRKGTPAAEMPNQIPRQVKLQRGRRLEALAEELRDDYYRTLLGSRLKVLIEGQLPCGHMLGTACRYATVELPGGLAEIGQFVEVTAREVRDGKIIAEA